MKFGVSFKFHFDYFLFFFFRSIRTNWATRKPAAPGSTSNEDSGYAKAPHHLSGSGNGGGGHHPGSGNSGGKNLNYDEVFGLASAMNFTVYCGGVMNSDENTIRAAFTPYGRILEIRYFRDKGYAFVRYDNKESACSAIVAVNMTQIAGQSVKCSWGKETSQQQQGQGGHATSPGGDFMPRTDMGPPHFAAEQPFYHTPQQQPQAQQQFYQQQMYDTSQQYMMQPQPQYYAAGNYGGYGGYPGAGGAPPPQGARNNY